MKRLLLALLATGAAAMSFASDYLTIGDKAPAISAVSWLKNGSVPSFENDKVYVVEFWATWCGPCRENIPKLTALASKYSGKATVIGLDVWETNDESDLNVKDRVVDFVTKQGAKMDYVIGMDDKKSTIADAWLKAAGEGGIPVSFVIGRDGNIAWMGHPEKLEAVLPDVLNGSFDVAAARKQRKVEVEVVRPVREAMAAKEYAKAISLMDAIVVKRPEMARYYAYDRYNATAHLDLAKTKTMSSDLKTESGGEIGVYQMMSSVYASESNLSPEAYRFGLTLVDEALAKKDREYLFLSMASAIHGFLGEKSEAIEFARKAVDAAKKDEHAPKPFIEFLQRNLEKLEKQ